MPLWTPRGARKAIVAKATDLGPAPEGNGWAAVPAKTQQALVGAGMANVNAFSPGAPIPPYFGYDQTPRTADFVTGRNIGARPRSDEFVSFETLTQLYKSYGPAQIAARHLINDVTSLDYTVTTIDPDETNADKWISRAEAALKKPDLRYYFKPWLKRYLLNVLRFDAGCLYRMKDNGGRVCGLRNIDGRTIGPLYDYFGDVPDDDAPAYVQWVNGLSWDWLTFGSLVYEPMWPQTESPYGTPPLETILLYANADVRFQVALMDFFSDSTLPAGFMEAPGDYDDPDKIQDLQMRWEGWLRGDQAQKFKVRWVPQGSKWTAFRTDPWIGQKDEFPLFLIHMCCAAFSVTPNDMGFTDNVNKSVGETQVDVQFRTGTAPLNEHVEMILDAYLQDDLGLPVKGKFDDGQEKEDRLVEAQVWQIGINMAAVSPDEMRRDLFSLPVDPSNPTPRGFGNPRAGFIPLSAVLAVGGQLDAATYAPEAGAELPKVAYGGIEGVLGNPMPPLPALSAQDYGTVDDGIADDEASVGVEALSVPTNRPAHTGPPIQFQPVAAPGQPATKEPSLTTAPSAADLVAAGTPQVAPGGDQIAAGQATTAKATDAWPTLADMRQRGEILITTPAAKATKASREWHNSDGLSPDASEAQLERHVIEDHHPTVHYSDLPAGGRDAMDRFHAAHHSLHGECGAHEVAKSIEVNAKMPMTTPICAGLVVKALDTGRVLMLQRAVCDDDPASGRWEWPGGHLEPGEGALEAAIREWQEEVGIPLPPGRFDGSWTSPDGVYRGFVLVVAHEADVAINLPAV